MSKALVWTGTPGDSAVWSEAGEGGGGAFHGAEIYCSTPTIGWDGVDLSPGQSLVVPFDSVQLDSDAIADLANNQLVIPAELDGVWTYGFAFNFQLTSTAAIRAFLDIGGDAWNLGATAYGIDTAAISLAASAIDLFSEGETLSVRMLSDSVVNLTRESGTRPRLFAYYLGSAA